MKQFLWLAIRKKCNDLFDIVIFDKASIDHKSNSGQMEVYLRQPLSITESQRLRNTQDI